MIRRDSAPVAGGSERASSDRPVLSVVIPVFNEVKTLESLIARVRAVPIEKEIVVVDDFSTDGSRELLARLVAPDLRAFFHDVNRGKGAALRTGFEAVRGDITIIQDADLEYDPAEFPKLVAPIVEGHADVVYGSRFLGGGPHRVLFFHHYLANKFLTFVSNVMTNLNLTDMETCYKVFRSSSLRQLNLRCERFGIEPELTAKIARKRFRVYEVPISYHGRDYSEGKKIGWKDAISALYWIVRFRFVD